MYCLLGIPVFSQSKQVRVFIALCDNKTQGIQPVRAKIGNGDDADANLYWGCSDGFGAYFKKSKHWEVMEELKDPTPQILRRIKLKHAKDDLTIIAEAYRGSQMRACLEAFEQTLASGTCDLAAYIGHNPLMDFDLEPPKNHSNSTPASMVFCCHSRIYFESRLKELGSEPLVLTEQLMYPGAFLLHDAIECWRKDGSKSAVREAVALAYSKNQKISVKAAAGIFSKLD